MALIPEGNLFHNPGAATWNNLSPRVFLVLTSGGINNSLILAQMQVISCPLF